MVKRRPRLRSASDRSEYMLKTSANCVFALDAFRRLRRRKKRRRVIGETGNELLHIKVLECPQKLSSERFNCRAIAGFDRLGGADRRRQHAEKCYHHNYATFINHRHDRRYLNSLIPLGLLPPAQKISL